MTENASSKIVLKDMMILIFIWNRTYLFHVSHTLIENKSLTSFIVYFKSRHAVYKINTEAISNNHTVCFGMETRKLSKLLVNFLQLDGSPFLPLTPDPLLHRQ